MQQFIPFEDDWDMLDAVRPEALIPYRVGLTLAAPASGTRSSDPGLLSMAGVLPVVPSIRHATLAKDAGT